MNIRDALRMGGFDIMEERIHQRGPADWHLEYDLRMSLESRLQLKKEYEEGIFRPGIDEDAIHSVYVEEVGFNGLGNLYVRLNDLSDDTCFDVIEFEGGKVRI